MIHPQFPPQRPGTPIPGTNIPRPQTPDPSSHFLFRIWRWIQQFFYDYMATLAYGVGLIAGGILIGSAVPALMLPCLGAGIGLITSAIVTKTLKRYTFVPLTKLQTFAVELESEYPKIHVIAFIMTCFLGSVCPPAALLAGAAIGFLSGFTTHPSMLNLQRGGNAGGGMRRGPSSQALTRLKA